MAINTALLIASPTFQDVLIDNVTGLPMANGTVTMFRDNARTILKNWYYQSGSPGAYTYITLPNPMTLSGIGTIVDNNGNDTIPFFYPFDEADNVTPQPYYVQVKNANGQQQFVRQNFPFNPNNANTPFSNPTLSNLIINGQFWRAAPQNGGNFTNLTQALIGPDQHDGYSMPDIQFFKSKNGANDTATIKKFAGGEFLIPPVTAFNNQDVTPEFYLNMKCTSATTGETFKYIQIPIQLHIKNLESTQVTFTFYARSVAGSNTFPISLLQFVGTGLLLSPAPLPLQTIALTTSWAKYTVKFTFPLIPLVNATGDDAWYIQLNYPLNTAYEIDIAKPSLYIGNTVPSNDFKTYDEINYVISSARTGDVRVSFNYLNNSIATPNYPALGWLPMKDGSIGSSASGATYANNDCWQLYNLLWNSTTNAQCLLFTTAGTYPARGASAFADFNANIRLFIPRALGRVFAGADPSGVNLAKPFLVNVLASLTAMIVDDALPFYNGMPVVFTNVGGALPAPLLPATTYYLVFVTSNILSVATSLANALSNNPLLYVHFLNNGSGTNSFTTTFAAHPFASFTGQDNPNVLEVAAGGAGVPPDFFTNLRDQVPQSGTFNNVQPTTYVEYLIKL